MNPFLEAALKYAALEWKIFPLLPGQKVPYTKHGVKDATSDPAKITEWWTRWPNANIGLACGPESGVYVIDVDECPENKVSGRESLKEFLPLPETVRQDTPRGGFHAFYRTDNPPANRNGFRPGIDIRGSGYYVVLPPSTHPNGRKYSWAPGHAPGEIELAEYPDFMRPVTRAPWASASIAPTTPRPHAASYADDALRRASLYLAQCEPAIQGQRGHDTLLHVASAMVRGFQLSDDQAFTLLANEYNGRCLPPWALDNPKDRKDFLRKITEARRLSGDKPDGWLLNDDSYLPADLTSLINGGQSAKALLADTTPKQGATGATKSEPIAIDDAGEYLEREPPPAEPLFPGLVDRGDKVFIVAQSKIGKTFFVLSLGAFAACGRMFLNWKPNGPLKVLFIQFELKRGNCWRRVRKIAAAHGITKKDLGGRLHILNLRGKSFSLDSLAVADYDLIIFDPFYKMADRVDADENSAKEVAHILGKLDELAEQGPAICVVHHGTKGRIGDKQVIDRASGSGVIARDFDGMLTLAPHQDHPGEWIVIEATLRNYPSPAAMTVQFRDCIFTVRPDVLPVVETSLTAKRAQQSGLSVEELAGQVGEWITEPSKTTDITDRIRSEFHVGRDKAADVVRQLERLGFVRGKSKTSPAYATIAPPVVQGSTDTPPKQKGFGSMT